MATRTATLSKPKSVFLRRTYAHVLGAILAVVAIEIVFFRTGFAHNLARRMLSAHWLLILGAFMIVAWMARKIAYRTRSLAGQYAGLSLYVVAKSLILIPLLVSAENFAPGALESAVQFTLIGALGLTAIVFISGKNFDFLRSLLRWGGFLALVAIVSAILFGYRLGIWFDFTMISLAGASILYDTSKILRRYHGDRYVAAALELFSSIAFMFWYALRMFRRLQN